MLNQRKIIFWSLQSTFVITHCITDRKTDHSGVLRIWFNQSIWV